MEMLVTVERERERERERESYILTKENAVLLDSLTHGYLRNNKGITFVTLVVTIIVLLIFVGIIIVALTGNNRILTQRQREKEELSEASGTVSPRTSLTLYDNQNDEENKVLITVEGESGLDYIECCSDDNIIYANGKKIVTFDYTMKKGENYKFKIKENDKDIKEENMTITDETADNEIKIEKVEKDENGNDIKMQTNIPLDNYVMQFSVDDGITWKSLSGNDAIINYSDIPNICIDENNIITIKARIKNESTSNIVYRTVKTEEVNAEVCGLPADSLLAAMEKYDFDSGIHLVRVKEVKYSLNVYAVDGDMTIDSSTQPFGEPVDVAGPYTYANNMVVLKVEKNLTIDSGAILTSFASDGGYGGPKGMMIYCKGTLTNNGTISMTARGAKAYGENVYLWKNADVNKPPYEYVPATGASGGVSITAGGNGVVKDRNSWR